MQTLRVNIIKPSPANIKEVLTSYIYRLSTQRLNLSLLLTNTELRIANNILKSDGICLTMLTVKNVLRLTKMPIKQTIYY